MCAVVRRAGTLRGMLRFESLIAAARVLLEQLAPSVPPGLRTVVYGEFFARREQD